MDNIGHQSASQNNHSNDLEMNNFMDVSRMSSMWPYSHPVERYSHYRDFYHENTSQPSVVPSHETANNVPQLMTNNTAHAIQQPHHTIVNNNVPVMGTLQTVLTQGLPTIQNVSANLVNAVNINHTPQTMSGIQNTIPISANSASKLQEQPTQILTRIRLQDLVREVDPNEQLDEDVEDILLQMADDFVESAINAGCLLAKHRKSNTVEVKDLQLHLERNWNMWIPGFGTDELRPYKRASVTEAHKQRLTLIRKTLKKY